MNRIELVQQLLRECVLSAAAVDAFLEKPRKYAADDNLYMREVHFVVAVGPDRSPTMSEMARSLNVTQGAVTQMVSRLEKKGYVVRSKDVRDKRMTTVSLTDQGRRLYEEHLIYDQKKFAFSSEYLNKYRDEDLEKLIEYEHLVQQLFTNQR